MPRFPRISVLSIAVAGAFLTTACTDLDAVRAWSETSVEATRFNEVVVTYAETPVRLARYDDQDGATQAIWSRQQQARQAQAEALEAMLALVSDYMSTLSALSADSTVDFSKEGEAFAGSLQRLNGVVPSSVSPETVGAVGSIVTTLADAALSGWQAKEVGKVVEQANAPLQTLLAGELRTIVDTDFRRDLDIERRFLDTHFESLLRDPTTSPAAAAALEEWFLVRQAENARRMAALDAYLEILDKIAQGHQRLYDGRGALDAVDLAKDLFKLVREIRDEIRIVARA